MVVQVETNQAYYSKWQHNPHLTLRARFTTPAMAKSLIGQARPWVEAFCLPNGPCKQLGEPMYFEWYCFSWTLIEVLVHTEQVDSVKIEEDKDMSCGGDEI